MEEEGGDMIEFVDGPERLANIKVVGVGGAGGNAVNRMVEAGLTGVEFHAINTDLQALGASRAHNALQIGARLTRGLGSGGDPSVGRGAAEEDQERIGEAVSGADMVFVTAGMGGGTGTGAAAIVAAEARRHGALTVAIVTRPFVFEGRIRSEQAETGITELAGAVDTLLVIPNQRLLEVVPPETSMLEAFRYADNVLYEATRGIHDIIAHPNHINLDFADVRAVMQSAGAALMGTGRAAGEDRARQAAEEALRSPLLEDVDIHGARGVLVNILGTDVSLAETGTVMQLVQDEVGDAAHVILGYGCDDDLDDTLQVTVIATGFGARGNIDSTFAPQVSTPVPARASELVTPEPMAEPAAAAAVAGRAETFDALEWSVQPPRPGAEITSEAIPAEPAPQAAIHADECPAEEVQGGLLRAEATPEEVATADPVLAPEPPEEATGVAEIAPPLTHEEPRAWEAAAGCEDRSVTAGSHELRQRFLKPVGAQRLPESTPVGDPPPSAPRRRSTGFRSDELVDDMNAPAYTRKYMD